MKPAVEQSNGSSALTLNPGGGGAPCRRGAAVVAVHAQVAAAVVREHRNRAEHRRRRRPRHHPGHHPRVSGGEAAGDRRPGGSDRRLLRRGRRDEHRRGGDRHAYGAGRPGTAALRRQGDQRLLPRAQPQDLPSQTKVNLGLIKSLMSGPKYDGKYLHSVVQKLLGDKRVNQTLTNVVIPTFDIKLLQPITFSRFDAQNDESKNALLSDVCISTSAAPTYLPGHRFETKDKDGNSRAFNLIDGGVAANNPTLLAMTHVSKQILLGNKDFFPIKPTDYGKFMILSLGTGSAKIEQKYDATQSSKWGILDWLYHDGSTPLIDSFSQASADLVDIHASVLFQALRCQRSYLRIQDDELTGDAASVDVSTPENLRRLVDVGRALLKKPACKVNVETGRNEPDMDRGTNEEELKHFAEMLSEERKARLLKKFNVQ
uniref:Patatin n=1 Tax=Oryza brachyantha TaxID=4533 RepID=J3MTT7_ORYBR